MSYFTHLLTSQAHTLRLPEEAKNDIERFVLQHQTGSVSPERAPFRRQLDFWGLSIVIAVALGLPPVGRPSRKWGSKFIDTRSVQMPDGLCEVLAVIALATLGPYHDDIDNPAMIVEIGNRYAGAGCPELLRKLKDKELRLTALDKVLEYAKSLRSEAKLET